MYEDILIPGTKAYYTAKGKFILLEKRFVSRCEDPGSPENWQSRTYCLYAEESGKR